MTQTSFINVDLELFSKEDLSSIAEELKGKIYPLTNEFIEGTYNLAFECSLNELEPSVVLEEFISLLNSLSAESKALLAECSQKVFDVGYDSGYESFVSHVVSNSLLSKIVDLGFELRLTVYQLESRDD